LGPEGIPLSLFSGRRYVKLPRHANAFRFANGAEEVFRQLVSSLEFPASKTGKCSIAHGILDQCSLLVGSRHRTGRTRETPANKNGLRQGAGGRVLNGRA
jgi:hypothetical protein